MMQFGFLPHQLVDCTLSEFKFDMNVLSRKGYKENLVEWARKAKADWKKRHKK